MLAPDGLPARGWFALTAVVVVVALAIQVPFTAAASDDPFFTTPGGRVANLFTFFTILSNLLVALTCATLAACPRRDGPLLRVARFDAVLGITVAGVVYHVLLAPLYHQHGAEAFANQLFHTVSPLLTVGGWVLFGPRGRVGRGVVAASLLYPLAWLVFALVRGALIGWYPYPFVDVIALGYARVAGNAVGLTVLFLALAAAYAALDRLLARKRGRAEDARIGV